MSHIPDFPIPDFALRPKSCTSLTTYTSRSVTYVRYETAFFLFDKKLVAGGACLEVGCGCVQK